MGFTRQSYIYVTHQSNHQLPESEHYISHNMFDMLVFLMVLCASTKKNSILVCQRLLAILCHKKTNKPGMMKVTCVICAEEMRTNNSRERPSEALSVLMLCASVFIFAYIYICLSIRLSLTPYPIHFSEFMSVTKHENTRSPPFSYDMKMATGSQVRKALILRASLNQTTIKSQLLLFVYTQLWALECEEIGRSSLLWNKSCQTIIYPNSPLIHFLKVKS